MSDIDTYLAQLRSHLTALDPRPTPSSLELTRSRNFSPRFASNTCEGTVAAG